MTTKSLTKKIFDKTDLKEIYNKFEFDKPAKKSVRKRKNVKNNDSS